MSVIIGAEKPGEAADAMPFDQLQRREFFALLGGAAAWPLAGRAQHAAKLPTIEYLGSGTPITSGH
ncbi:MAG TPA: hypothetical protein VKB89_20880 [Xanthobacteraceae bacterium]|nr:hypothetical protein [Xanthobacteraceae bacterium]